MRLSRTSLVRCPKPACVVVPSEACPVDCLPERDTTPLLPRNIRLRRLNKDKLADADEVGYIDDGDNDGACVGGWM